MSTFDPAAYGPMFEPLLAIDRRRPLDARHPDVDAEPALAALTVDNVLAPERLADGDMAACSIAGVWLLHDCLDESHTISQGIDTPSGSFWHAIMHRREGDFSNAKYWFHHVGQHPVFEKLEMRAAEIAAEHGETAIVRQLTAGNRWNPFALVDLCQADLRGRDATRDTCRDIQQVEWELLFDFCFRAAVGE